MYNKETFTYGAEIEWGDIDRTMNIPSHLGNWEHAETDIVNIHPPYRYIACDPLGLEPPMGGEINTKPTKTWQEQVDRVVEIYDMFVTAGDNPSASCVNHGHIHVFVPGLKDDVAALKRLISYIKANQTDTIEACYQFHETSEMKQVPGAKMYLKFDGGREMPDYMCDNIINLATDFNHFIKLHAAGKDGVSMGRPFRYAINMYCMKHTGTIEFRLFRHSFDRRELEDSFKFVEMFIDAALNNGSPVEDILASYDFKFPQMSYDHQLWLSYEKTKYDKSRGEKKREFHEAT